jgi:uncharacterized protein YndB with AHSA1/START domain
MLQKKKYTITINTAKNIVWHTLWSDEFYPQWTAAFTSGSQAQSDWKEGSEILFLDGKGGGMYSVIAKRDEPNYMAFRHIGEIKDGVKQAASDWDGALETYTLSERGGATEVTAEVDIEASFVDFMERTFPKAMTLLKDIAESDAAKTVRIETTVAANVATVWERWTTPADIMQWNNASDDWHTPSAQNDLRVGGSFTYRMASKDGSSSFDFNGTYDEVRKHELIAYTIEGGRQVCVEFKNEGGKTRIIESFEVETEFPVAFQRQGWQAILDNFRRHVESR